MQAANTAMEAKLEVQKLQELPPLPMVGQRLLELLSDDEVEIEDVVRTLELDPGLSARIIGLARSAFFGNPGPIYTVNDAIIRVLGLNLVKSLAFGIIIGNGFSVADDSTLDLNRYWGTAMLTAAISRELAPYVSAPHRLEPNRAYLCGLLHNLGLLPLAHIYPEELNRACRLAAEPGGRRSLEEALQEMLGIDQHEAGGYLAHRWHLPEEVVNVMAYHHRPDYQGDHWPLARLVGSGARWAAWRLRGEDEMPLLADALGALGIGEAVLAKVQSRMDRQHDKVMEMAAFLAG